MLLPNRSTPTGCKRCWKSYRLLTDLKTLQHIVLGLEELVGRTGTQTAEDHRPPRDTAPQGHVGLLACSGMLNGFFGEVEMAAHRRLAIREVCR
jgi:hypothetical protein